MLGKLTKYELRATARNFLPLYIVILAFSAISRIFFQIGVEDKVIDTISNLTMIGYVSVIIATFVVTLVVLVQRFYKNLLCDEGYLMHTLPVKPWQNIGAKLLVVIVWNIATLIVVTLSVLIMVVDTSFLRTCMEAFQYIMECIAKPRYLNIAALFFEGLLVLFTQMIATILMVYVSLAIGNLFHKYRVGAALIAFICIFFALNTIASIAMLLVDLTPIADFISSLSAETTMHCIFLGGTFINITLCVIYFAVTNYILKRHLNLQ